MSAQADTSQATAVLTLSDWANISTVGACIIGVISIIFLIYQLKMAREALCAQVSATEAEVYTSLNSEFLNIVSSFPSKINDPATTLSDLSDAEKRSIDRYFYLANTEFNLVEQGIISTEEFKNHWISGIKSGAKRKPFAERWESLASSFSFSNKFKELVNNSIEEHRRNGSL